MLVQIAEAASTDPFKKVLDMISKLIASLEQQQNRRKVGAILLSSTF